MPATHVVAKVLLADRSGKVLILRRSETDTRRPLQGDILGGWVDEGENFTTAAVRETKEEAGIVIEPSELQLVYAKSGIVNQANVCWLFFIGHTDSKEVKLSSEHDKANWLSLEEAIENVTYDIQKDFLLYVRDNNLL